MAKYQVHFQTKDERKTKSKNNPIHGWKTYEANSFEEAEDLWNQEHRFDKTKQLIFTEKVG